MTFVEGDFRTSSIPTSRLIWREQLDEVEEGTKPWVSAVQELYAVRERNGAGAEYSRAEGTSLSPDEPTVRKVRSRMMEIKLGRTASFSLVLRTKKISCKNTQNFERLPDGTIKIVS